MNINEQFEKQQEEIAVLKAQVNEVRDSLVMLFNGGWDEQHSANISAQAKVVINKTPKQCLNSVKASAVQEFANRYCGDCTTEYETKLNEDANEWACSVTVTGEG